MSGWAKKLKDLMRIKGLTQQELANRIGVNRTQISNYINGRRQPSFAKMKLIAENLSVKFEELWSTTDSIPLIIHREQFLYIPVIDWVNAGDKPQTHKPPLKESEFVAFPKNKCGGNCYALIVNGDSMSAASPSEKSFFPGDRIIVDPDLEPLSGDCVIASLNPTHKHTTFKQYMEDGVDKYLKPLNSQYPAIKIKKSIQILGVVRGSISYQK